MGNRTLETDDAILADIAEVSSLTHTVTGTPAAGIGAMMSFRVENAATTPEITIAAQCGGVLTTVTDGSEVGAFDVYTRRAGGALTRVLRADGNGGLTISQRIATTGSPVGLTLTGGAHTTLTASTEAPDLHLDIARTVEFSTGAITTQRAVHVEAPTYAFVGASTITNAATVYIADAPQAGTNATLTNPYALWVDSGTVRIDGTLNPQGTLTIGGALDHDGSTVGFYGVTPATRPTAYTQTFATADKTHSNATTATLTDSSGGTAADTISAITGGGANCENATKNAVATFAREQARLVADIDDVKRLVNSVIDDLQTLGLLQ